MRKGFLKLLVPIVPSVILFFLIRDIYRNWSEIRAYAVNINYLWIFLSYLGFLIATLIMTVNWHLLLKKLKTHIDLKASIAIWSVSTLGKYIPGKGWQFVSIVYISKKFGVSYSKSLSASLMGQIFSIISGLIVGFSVLRPYIPSPLMAVILAASLIFIYPDFLNRLTGFLSRLTGKQVAKIDLSLKDTLEVTSIYLTGWLFFGLSLNFLLFSIYPNWGFQIFYSAKIFVSSYLIGLFAIFVPGGIGVREGIMAVLLAKSLPSHLAPFIALFTRLVVTLSEITLTFYGLYFLNKSGFSIIKKNE